MIREMKSVSTPAFSMAFSMAFSRAFFRAYFALAFALYVGLISPSHADPLADAITETKANIVFMRHALAPGYGDPAHFDIRDCTTQRNLDAVGLKQAELTGAWLRDQGFVFDTIFSSAWCRCMDTAMALDLGQWQVFAGLNSFFEGHVDRDQTLKILSQYLMTVEPDDRVLLVTHQVVISAVTGIAPPSGGMVVYNTSTGMAKSVHLDLE